MRSPKELMESIKALPWHFELQEHEQGGPAAARASLYDGELSPEQTVLARSLNFTPVQDEKSGRVIDAKTTSTGAHHRIVEVREWPVRSKEDATIAALHSLAKERAAGMKKTLAALPWREVKAPRTSQQEFVLVNDDLSLEQRKIRDEGRALGLLDQPLESGQVWKVNGEIVRIDRHELNPVKEAAKKLWDTIAKQQRTVSIDAQTQRRLS